LQSSTLCDHRERESAGQSDLLVLQKDLCRALGRDLSIYQEKDEDLPAVATPDELRRLLRDDAQSLCAVLSTRHLTLDYARVLIGRNRAKLIRQTADGFLGYPFLAAG